MKINLTIRLTALLLCMVMLFTVSCAAPVTNNPPEVTDAPVSTPDDTPEEPDTPAAVPDPTPEEPDTPTSAPEQTQDPDFPENGAKTIITKTVKLYQTEESVQDITVAHYEGTPEILLIDTKTMFHEFFDELLNEKGPFTCEETDTTLTISRPNGAYCTLDFVEDTMYFNNFDMFTAFGTGNMADLLSSSYADKEGNNVYFLRTGSFTIDGLPLIIDLTTRDIPLDIYEGKKYIPFQTFNDVFLAPHLMNIAYNGQDLFWTMGGTVDSSVSDEYYSIGPAERSEALIEYTVNELCLFLDLFYGLQNEHGVTYGFDTFIQHTGLWDDLTSPDAKTSGAALASLMIEYLADNHSFFDMASPYTGTPETKDYIKYPPSFLRYYDYLYEQAGVRGKLMPDGVEGYLEVGNTAYITFDSFDVSSSRSLDQYDEAAAEISDTFGLIIYSHRQITRENSPVENVVLDLSCNSGGAVDAAIYVVGWMLGYCDFHLTNPITGSYATTSYKVDVNLDGVFDEKDTVADKNLYCLISPSSFSCGNLVPSLLKESGRVTMLGGTSGGGACSVQFATLADGTIFQISSPHHLCVVSNGAYYTVDRGVEPHYFFGKFESYFDRAALAEYINALK